MRIANKSLLAGAFGAVVAAGLLGSASFAATPGAATTSGHAYPTKIANVHVRNQPTNAQGSKIVATLATAGTPVTVTCYVHVTSAGIVHTWYRTAKTSGYVAGRNLSLPRHQATGLPACKGGRVVAYRTDGRSAWTFTTDGDVQALTYLGGIVYLGGHFDHACTSAVTGAHGFCVNGSVPRIKLAAADASTGALQTWTPAGNGIHGVFTMTSNAGLGTVDAGGEFTTLGGVSHGRFGQFH